MRETAESEQRRLAALPAAVLVHVVLDSNESWLHRRDSARALAGRVPAERAAELLACAQDTHVTAEVRVALLGVLSTPGSAHAGELLRWLRTQDEVEKQPYNFDTAILLARANLGDLTALDQLTELAADPWGHRRLVGERAIDATIEVHGQAPVLAALDAGSPEALATAGSTPARRLLGLRLLFRAGADTTPLLADESALVARQAYHDLSHSDEYEPELLAMVEQRRPGHLWALAVLAAREHDIEPMWDALGRPRVELPAVPPDVREAIVRQYAPGQGGTDPRWLVEAACLPPSSQPGEAELLSRATGTLAAAGLEPEAPVSAGDFYEQGKGTYHTIKTAAGTVVLSTLGPYTRRSLAEHDDDNRAIDALLAAGFRDIDPVLAGTRFDGLAVYYFGSREPLTVGQLLFYWQD